MEMLMELPRPIPLHFFIKSFYKSIWKLLLELPKNDSLALAGFGWLGWAGLAGPAGLAGLALAGWAGLGWAGWGGWGGWAGPGSAVNLSPQFSI